MSYSFDSTIVSDLHKDAYGYRPSQSFFAEWAAANDDKKQQIWDHLVEAVEASIAYERDLADHAVLSFEKSIADLIALGAGNRDTAIRWFVDGFRDEFSCNDGAGYLCYRLGLPYSMESVFKKFI